MKRRFTFYILFSLSFYQSFSQEVIPDNIRLFIDCQRTFCDFNYIKNEINYVNYVNDRFQADVHILLTSQFTASGGRDYRIQITGQGPFAGMADTLSYIRPAGATEDEDRRLGVQTIKQAILPYLLKTERAKNMVITFKPTDPKKLAKAPEKDPWNFWVMNISTNASFNGDKNYSYKNYSGAIAASRITNKLKVDISVSGSNVTNRYGTGVDRYKFTNKSYYFNNTTVWALGPKFSAGASVGIQRSDYGNFKLSASLTPALEYNFFPYDQSRNKSFTLMYRVGPRYFNYFEETVYLQTEEVRFQESLTTEVSFNQPWGQINASSSYSHYFHDFSKNRLSFYGNADLRIFKGFFLNFNGSYSFSHDQLNIIKGDVTDQDLLTRRRQLDSNYNFYFNYGLRYRFGSLYNNIVNPRF